MEDMKSASMGNWLKFNGIKIGAIIQVGVLYFIISIIIFNLIRKLFDTKEEVNYDEKPLWKITLEVLFQTVIIILGNWIAHKIVGKIPYMFDGEQGFMFNKLKERNGTIFGAFTLLLFIGQYKDKIVYLVNRYKNLLHV